MLYRRYRSDTKIDASGNTDMIKARKVPDGYVLEVTSMMCANYTRVNKQIAIGYYDPAEAKHYLVFDYNTYHNMAQLNGEAWIEAGETPIGEAVGATAGDDIYLSVHGKLWPRALWKAKDAKVQREPDVSDDSKPQ